MKLNSRQFPSLGTFVAAVKINGIDHYNTVFHVNTLSASFKIRTDPSSNTVNYKANHHGSGHHSLAMGDDTFAFD